MKKDEIKSMFPSIVCLNMGVCSAWGRKLDKHVYFTRQAPKRGHQYCLNCGMTRDEARKDCAGSIEYGIVDERTLELLPA